MIKIVLVGLWAAGLATGSAYYFVSTNQMSSEGTAGNVVKKNLEHLKMDLMSIAMIRNNEIGGYLLLEPIVITNSDVISQLTIPLNIIARDVIIGIVHANDDIDIHRLEKFNLDDFRKRVVKLINTRIGKPVVDDVLIQSIDFINKEDVRDLQLRRS